VHIYRTVYLFIGRETIKSEGALKMMTKLIITMTTVAVTFGIFTAALNAQATKSNAISVALAKSSRLARTASPCDGQTWPHYHRACLISIYGHGKAGRITSTRQIRYLDKQTSGRCQRKIT
jgi:hypothetical protein